MPVPPPSLPPFLPAAKAALLASCGVEITTLTTNASLQMLAVRTPRRRAALRRLASGRPNGGMHPSSLLPSRLCTHVCFMCPAADPIPRPACLPACLQEGEAAPPGCAVAIIDEVTTVYLSLRWAS